MTSAVTSEVENLKARLKSIWTAGDYDRFSRYMEGGAREFYERLNIAPGCSVAGRRLWVRSAGADRSERRHRSDWRGHR